MTRSLSIPHNPSTPKNMNTKMFGIFLFLVLFSTISCSSNKLSFKLNETNFIVPEPYLTIEENDYQFDMIGSLTINSSGEISVYDQSLSRVLRFDSNGSLIQQIYLKNIIPNSIIRITNMYHVDDTLYTFDYSNSRLYRLTTTVEGDYSLDSFIQLKAPEDQRIIGALETNGHIIVETVNINLRERYLMLFDMKGETVNEGLLYLPTPKLIEVHVAGNAVLLEVPFSGRNHYRVSNNDTFFHAWSEEYTFHQYNTKGETISSITIQLDNQEISDSELLYRKETTPSNIWKQLKNDIPRYHPYFKNFIVDDEDQIWIDLGRSAENKDYCAWIVINHENVLKSFMLPCNFNAYELRDGKLFGIYKGDTSKIKAYKIIGN